MLRLFVEILSSPHRLLHRIRRYRVYNLGLSNLGFLCSVFTVGVDRDNTNVTNG